MFNKKFKIYAVGLKSEPDKFICYCNNKKEATEYAYNFLKLKNYEHFCQWCIYEELDKKSPEAFFQYYTKVISLEEKADYVIHKIYYKKKDISLLLRIFGKCIPLGCSYESEFEHFYFKAQEEKLQKLNDILNKDLNKNNDKENIS